MASAYAAGMASSSTKIVDAMLAVAELISGGHGLAPVVAPKNSGNRPGAGGGVTWGGWARAPASLCGGGTPTPAPGRKTARPPSHATSPHSAFARRPVRRRGTGTVAGLETVVAVIAWP